VARKLRLKLFWCWTEDHDEDWFVVAKRSDEAKRFFLEFEGYDYEEVMAKPLLVLPEGLQDDKHCGHPNRELLEACGATILRWETPRVVELNGMRWVEGMLEHQIRQLDDDHLERSGHGRPNRTQRNSTS